MQSSWRFFIVTELLLFLWAVYQLFDNVPVLLILIFAIINFVYSAKKVYKTSFNQFQKIGSLAAMLICLLYSPAVWLMLVLAILFVGLKGVEVSGIDLFSSAPWRKKQIKMVKTTASEPKSGRRFKRPWVGNQRFGSDTYEWDDINMSIIYGDTIIDLGNTLLPKEDNVVIVRKGFGKTRILVPTGIGVCLEHSAMIGEAAFEGEHFNLKNESLKLYSNEFDEAARRVKIVTNTLFGDIEVIRV
ncbi:cell wall-active antibiotics response protein LiaF [Vagococcus hydrophili]|uniref:Cell wall-active antibiotics response protein n=1 Tax=Vagococcus hydrophili TaxID=2714947 RepID=A0A6G8AVP2_9ENTE|nr:cell wall-active antibiotics response protein LiaF [Vagococcus hydrophili]QIL49039.1 cell wall-active antibiotics response protein [Vagococcus hydrophili]